DVVPQTGDEELLARIAAGDREAFAALWRRYAPAVVTLATRELRDQAAAEDVAQEVFTSIWRAAARFDAGRGAAASWIFTIARNATGDAQRRRRAVPVEHVEERADPEPGPEQRALGSLEAFQVHAAVAALPDGARELIELAYFEGLSQSEIAERTGVPL